MKELFAWVSDIDILVGADAAVEVISEVKERLDRVCSSERLYGLSNMRYSLRCQFDELIRLLHDSMHPDIAENYLIEFWETMEGDSASMTFLGAHQISKAKDVLGQRVRKRLLDKQNEHGTIRIELGYKLLTYKDPEFVALNILNAYHEPGHSGENPFLSNFVPSSENALCEYLFSLSPETIDVLKGYAVPGLVDFIMLLRENPSTYMNEKIGEGDDEVKNPIYVKTQEARDSIALHFLKEGTTQEKLFAAEVLRRGYGEFGPDTVAKVEACLKKESNLTVRKGILTLIVERSTYHNPDLAQFVLEYEASKIESPTNDTKAFASEHFKNFIDKELSEENAARFAKLSGLDPETIKGIHFLISSLEAMNPYLSGHYTVPYNLEERSEYLDRWAKVAAVPDAIGTILELSKLDYHFSLDESSMLPELVLEKELIVNGILNIREYLPNYQYRMAYDFTYEEGKQRKVYSTNPYKSALDDIHGEMLFEVLEKVSSGEEGQGLPEPWIRGLISKFSPTTPEEEILARIPGLQEALADILPYFEIETPLNAVKSFLSRRDAQGILIEHPAKLNLLKYIASELDFVNGWLPSRMQIE